MSQAISEWVWFQRRSARSRLVDGFSAHSITSIAVYEALGRGQVGGGAAVV